MYAYLITFTVLCILFFYAWAFANSDAARALVAELTRRWRLHLIQHGGEKLASQLISKVRRHLVEEGFDPEEIDEVVHIHKPFVIQRLGTQYANAHLGEPTPLERYS